MRPAETIHQAELNVSGPSTRIPAAPTAHTPPPSTGNSSRPGVREFEEGGSVTILTFAISDLDRQGYFSRLSA